MHYTRCTVYTDWWQCRAVSIMWVESREWTKLGGMAFFCLRVSGGNEGSAV